MVYCCSCVKSTGKGREFSNGRERDGEGEARDGEAWPGRGRRRARWNGRSGEHEGARGSRGLCLREAGSEASGVNDAGDGDGAGIARDSRIRGRVQSR